MRKFSYVRGLLLTILVILSVVLSYLIWKAQPNYESIDVKEVKNTAIDKQKTASQVFKPLLAQVNQGGLHYQTNTMEFVNQLATQGRSFTFSEIVSSGKKSSQEYDRLIHQNGTVELVYPNNIPFAVFSQIYELTGKELESASFNRIVFDTNTTEAGLYTVYFTNDRLDTVYQSSLPQKDIAIVRNLVDNANEADGLTKVDEVSTSNHTLFLSKKATTLKSKKYIIDTMDISSFTKALFPDASSVKNEDNSYTDGSSKIVLDTDNKVLEYINPAQENTNPAVQSEMKRASMIQDSFNFINEHSGWTDEYYFTGYNLATGSTKFSMFVDNLQVLSDNGMSEMIVTEGQEAVYKYSRPFFKLDYTIPRESENVTLPSSNAVFEKLQREGIDMDGLQMITLGYKMNWSEDKGLKRIVELKPTWIYKYHGKWIAVDMKERD
ncbi:transcriptional regulator [Listeria aquatica]|uniref:Transcriptional regulator n=1 Tax=Listeria aquatica TaxID=1494960 RepID=A0A841ZSG5_9LIST|nr:two-component system activity regulator YycH [Listeria aquatica]MBC1521551.1 transcriptional regulator [Listeria aquatica]